MKLTLISHRLLIVKPLIACTDPEGGGGGGVQRGRTMGGGGGPEGEDNGGPDTPQGPLENHKLYGFLGISDWNPWKKLDPLFYLGK